MEGTFSKLLFTLDTLKYQSQPRETALPLRNSQAPKQRICIIGAGPAGIHMGVQLKKRGHDVTILEKTSRLGGKTHNFKVGDVTYYTGGAAGYNNCYESALYAFTGSNHEKYRHKYSNTTVRTKDRESFISRALYSLQKCGYGDKSTSEQISYVHSQVMKYAKVHKELTGYTEYFFSEKKLPSSLQKTSFYEFLQMHKLDFIMWECMTTFTSQGYGIIDKISVHYGLLWCQPSIWFPILYNLKEGYFDSDHAAYAYDYQSMFEDMAKWNNLNIVYNVENLKCVRETTQVKVSYTEWFSSDIQHATFDTLISAVNPKCLNNAFELSETEKTIFDDLIENEFITTLCASNGSKNYDVAGVFETLNDHRFGMEKNDVVFIRNEKIFSTQIQDKKDSTYYMVCAQLNYNENELREGQQASINTNKNALSKLLKQYPKLNLRPISQWNYPYFQRWRSNESNAKFHKLRKYNLRNKNRTLWIGTTSIFECVPLIMHYNDYLIAKLGF